MDSSSLSSMEVDRCLAIVAQAENPTEEVRSQSRSKLLLENSALSGPPRSLLIAGAKQDHQESGSCTSFYLFFCGTFLFTMACTLLSTGVWCFLVRLPMIHLVREPTRIIVALSGYIAAAGTLTFPASCILYREHNVTRRSLLPVIVLLSLCTIFLVCCASQAIVYRKSAYSDLADLPTSCCGVNDDVEDGVSNWTSSAAPASCSVAPSHGGDDNSGGKKRSAPRPGCLDAITLDLMWITAYIVGLCFIAISANVLVILSIGFLLRNSVWEV